MDFNTVKPVIKLIKNTGRVPAKKTRELNIKKIMPEGLKKLGMALKVMKFYIKWITKKACQWK